ncbi:MAG: hypothetical protein Q7T01_02095 [bacterium]|nr:hypothetical protein [bacterium]
MRFSTSRPFAIDCRAPRAGQMLIEAILALALLAVVVGGSLTVGLRSFDVLERSRDTLTAATVGQESIEALRALAAGSWESLADGTYGLARGSGGWSLVPSPDVVDNRYTRTITVVSVFRDAACALAQSGTYDPDAKRVTATIAWASGGATRTRMFTTHVANWRGAGMLCSATEAGSLVIDVSGACIGGEQKQLEGVVFRNIGLRDITVDRLTLSWVLGDGTSPGNIQSVKVGGQDVWHATSSGDWSPHGAQVSGTELAIANVTIAAGSAAEVDRFRFDRKLAAAAFTLAVRMLDASTDAESTTFLTNCD